METKTKQEEESAFGQGLTYCLGLFLAHSERDYLMTEDDRVKGIINKPSMWFYAAADHLFDLQIPKNLPIKLKRRLSKFKSKVVGLRLPMDEKKATEKDKIWAIQEAKELLLEIDKFWGVDVLKGGWE